MTAPCNVGAQRRRRMRGSAAVASHLLDTPGTPMLLCLLASIDADDEGMLWRWDDATLQVAFAEAELRGLIVADPPMVTPRGLAWAHEHLAPLAPFLETLAARVANDTPQSTGASA